MKNAKKSMFITTVLMVAVLIVAVSTATFAWYTASNGATASQANITAAQSSDANIAVGWTSDASGNSITFDSAATTLKPMCPIEAPVVGTTKYSGETGALKFNTQSLDAFGRFNDNGDTTASATTPWTVSNAIIGDPDNGGVAAGEYHSFYIINKNQNGAASVDMTFSAVGSGENNSKLVVAVFAKQGAETEATLKGVFCNVSGGFVAGSIQNEKTPAECLTAVNSTDVVKTTITFELTAANTTGSYAEIFVMAWLDGTALGQETAGKGAAFMFNFEA
ncbi:MAG: hypothetical protein IKA77_01995 [Clostridia bacterium]|nr:hypothetical protein [Clostridia bacterium]